MGDIDPKEIAERLEDVVDDIDDMSGEAYGEGLPDHPPEHDLSAKEVGRGRPAARVRL